MTTKHRIFTMPFAKVYPLYLEKAEKKGRTKSEVDAVICWLTGYSQRQLDVQVKKQYRNLGDGLAKEPRAAAYAVEAHRRLGREAKLTIVRGGTDGSQLTEKGLPTPNLSTGEHNPHSPLQHHQCRRRI